MTFSSKIILYFLAACTLAKILYVKPVDVVHNDFDSITFALDETVQNPQVYLALKSELDPFVFKD